SALEVQVHNLPAKRNYQTFIVKIFQLQPKNSSTQHHNSLNNSFPEENEAVGLRIELDELYPEPPYRFVEVGTKLRLKSQQKGVFALIDVVVVKLNKNSILVNILDWQRLQQRRHHRALVAHFSQFKVLINEASRKLDRIANIEDISVSGLLISTPSLPPIYPPFSTNEKISIQLQAKNFESISAIASIRHAMPVNNRKKIIYGLEIESFKSEVDELRYDQLNRQMRLYSFNMPQSHE
ncbi:MAG: PilZ domain-containing protein, partial [Pseudomonadota bacterium]